MAERADVVVVGGGLAGITAALRLADSGRAVTLIEGRPRLGGAAFSFRRGELSIDNGQHVFLRCCTAYRWLLERIGATGDTVLQPRLDIPVLSPDGRSARLRRTPGLPAPLHLSAALAGYGLLSLPDRLRAARGALALKRLDPADPALDTQRLGQFLRAHGQHDTITSALWGIVATATLNLPPDEASLALAAKVFRTGLLDAADAGDVGYAAAPLGALHSDAARAALDAAGVEVVTGVRVGAADPGGTVRAGERSWHAGTVVLAVPPRDAFAITPALAESGAAPAAGLHATPIVNVHVVYDRTVTEHAFAAAVGSPVQWLFDRTDSSGVRDHHPGAQYLAVTVSAAYGVIDQPARTVVERFVAALGRLLPAAGNARVIDSFVTRERRATFRQAPGSAACRPAARSGPDGIVLAGAWTATGWPDTMESAVRSGIAAADAAIQEVAAVPSDVVRTGGAR